MPELIWMGGSIGVKIRRIKIRMMEVEGCNLTR